MNVKRKEWDLIVDSDPGEGSWNMAVDEFLFQSIDAEKPQTILRFYSWKRPTVSVGYSQNAAGIIDLDFCRGHGIDIVRRTTGGKLVLHHEEVTYSLVSTDNEIFPPTVTDSYRKVSEALMVGLRAMGLEPHLAKLPPDEYVRGHRLCFSYPARNEVEVNGKKIIGSAQKRTGSKFIQHGLIPLQNSEKLLSSVALFKGKEDIRMISLSQALGKEADFDRTVPILCAGISEYFDVDLNRRRLTQEEKLGIRQIQRKRYASPDWTYKVRD
jgi:lipoate-protein ligase A